METEGEGGRYSEGYLGHGGLAPGKRTWEEREV